MWVTTRPLAAYLHDMLQYCSVGSGALRIRSLDDGRPENNFAVHAAAAVHVTNCFTSHVTRHTSHVTRHTSHVTRHTSHVTRHTSPAQHAAAFDRRQARDTCIVAVHDVAWVLM